MYSRVRRNLPNIPKRLIRSQPKSGVDSAESGVHSAESVRRTESDTDSGESVHSAQEVHSTGSGAERGIGSQ